MIHVSGSSDRARAPMDAPTCHEKAPLRVLFVLKKGKRSRIEIRMTKSTPMYRHSQPPTERQKRLSASTTVISLNGNGLCRKRSDPQKSRPTSRVSGISFAGSKRKAERKPETETEITNGNFDNTKHTAQRKNFRWRCLHSEISSRPEKNANYPMGANQTMRTSSKSIPAENMAIFPVQETRKIYEKRRIFHENRTYQEAESH